MFYPPKYFCSFTQLFQINIFVFLRVAVAQLELIIIMFHCHICILLISSFPMIYIYCKNMRGRCEKVSSVWETVSLPCIALSGSCQGADMHGKAQKDHVN